MPEPYLVMDRVTAKDRGRTVLDDLALTLETGQTLALLGPAGAGKTALLLVLAGLLRPAGGRIVLAGRDITAVPPHARDIAMAFDSDALFPHLSVLDNVAFGLKMRRVARRDRLAQAAATLQALGIAALAQRPPARLSGPERRLVALARAAAVHPALLLVDETSAPEDAASREAARAVLRAALGPEHTTAILATHDRSAAFGLADRVALLRAGRLEQIGPPQTLYEEPATAFAAQFTGACNLLPATLLHERDGAGVISLAGATASARCRPGLRPGRVLVCLRPHKLQLLTQGGIAGIVDSVVYQGAITRVVTQMAGTVCEAETTQPPPGLARGAGVAVGWASADAWLIAQEGAP